MKRSLAHSTCSKQTSLSVSAKCYEHSKETAIAWMNIPPNWDRPGHECGSWKSILPQAKIGAILRGLSLSESFPQPKLRATFAENVSFSSSPVMEPCGFTPKVILEMGWVGPIFPPANRIPYLLGIFLHVNGGWPLAFMCMILWETRSTAFRRPWCFCDQRGVMDDVWCGRANRILVDVISNARCEKPLILVHKIKN